MMYDYLKPSNKNDWGLLAIVVIIALEAVVCFCLGKFYLGFHNLIIVFLFLLLYFVTKERDAFEKLYDESENDVRYLIDICKRLQEKLKEKEAKDGQV